MKLCLIISLLLVAVSCHSSDADESSNLGKVRAGDEEFPFMVAIGYEDARTNTNKWVCGGILLSHRHVLTAVDCTQPPNNSPVLARVGETSLIANRTGEARVIKIVERLVHPSFKRPITYNDIAIVKLETPVTFSRHVRPACLPKSTRDTDLPSELTAVGWGQVRSDAPSAPTNLMKVNLNLVNYPQCLDKYFGVQPTRRAPQGILDESQVCAGDVGRDTCQGDSGGPLVIPSNDNSCKSHQVVGIISFGIKCGAGYPTVSTRVSHYIPWINSIITS